MPRSSPSASATLAPSSVASSEPGSPASTAAAPAPVVPVFRIPANKPIFLPRLKAPAPAKPRAAPAKQASPRTTGAVGTSSKASPKASPMASPKASGGARGPKRTSTDSQLVPEFASEDAVRRASVPMLHAWLRDKGVSFRSKDKKADLVEKAIEHLAVLRRS
ncbi:uncharacterized protein LOC127749653 [Frankliniella occidentalis]|uniref:Uncharacterized protein LOC127749653 n=1 Tax=Frankliniella occidentalis TaxID=133901 RepID=A0A9C6UA39_FRAOC|nr:uncharacterized protein LOC127749653 [Frankliniella occidentalis]